MWKDTTQRRKKAGLPPREDQASWWEQACAMDKPWQNSNQNQLRLAEAKHQLLLAEQAQKKKPIDSLQRGKSGLDLLRSSDEEVRRLEDDLNEVFPETPQKHWDMAGFASKKDKERPTSLDQKWTPKAGETTHKEMVRQKGQQRNLWTSYQWTQNRDMGRAAELAVFGKGSLADANVIKQKWQREKAETYNLGALTLLRPDDERLSMMDYTPNDATGHHRPRGKRWGRHMT